MCTTETARATWVHSIVAIKSKELRNEQRINIYKDKTYDRINSRKSRSKNLPA